MEEIVEGEVKSLSTLCLEYIGEYAPRFSAESLQDLPGMVLTRLLYYLSPAQLNNFHHVFERAGVDPSPIWKRHGSKESYCFGSFTSYGLRIMDPFHKHDNHREGFMKNIFHQTLTAYNKNKNSKPTEKVFGEFDKYMCSLHRPPRHGIMKGVSLCQYGWYLRHMAAHVSKLSLRADDVPRIAQNTELMVRLQRSVKTLVLSNITFKSFETLEPLLHALVCCGQLEHLELSHCKFTVAQWKNLLAHVSGQHYCGATVAGTEHEEDCRFRHWTVERNWVPPCLCMYQRQGQMPSLPEEVLKASKEAKASQEAKEKQQQQHASDSEGLKRPLSSCSSDHPQNQAKRRRLLSSDEDSSSRDSSETSTSGSETALREELEPAVPVAATEEGMEVSASQTPAMTASCDTLVDACTSDDALMDDVLSAQYGKLDPSATNAPCGAAEGLYSDLDKPPVIPHAWPRMGNALTGFVCLECEVKFAKKQRAKKKEQRRVTQPCCLPALIGFALRSWTAIKQLAVPGRCCKSESDDLSDQEKLFSCQDYAAILAWHLERDDFTHLVLTPTAFSTSSKIPTEAIDLELLVDGLCKRNTPLQLLDWGDLLAHRIDDMEAFLTLPGAVSARLHSLRIKPWFPMGEYLGKWSYLRDLDLNGFQTLHTLEDSSGSESECVLRAAQQQWIEILKHCLSLETLLLPETRSLCETTHGHWIEDHLEEFAISIVKHPCLTKLDLQSTRFGDDGGSRLVYLLFKLALEEKRLPRLRHLNLSGCQVNGPKLIEEGQKITALWQQSPNARSFLKDLIIKHTNMKMKMDDCTNCKTMFEKLGVTLDIETYHYEWDSDDDWW